MRDPRPVASAERDRGGPMRHEADERRAPRDTPKAGHARNGGAAAFARRREHTNCQNHDTCGGT